MFANQLKKNIEMSDVRNFVLELARAGMSANDIKAKADNVFKDKAYSVSQIYRLISKVKNGEEEGDLRGKNQKTFRRTPEFVARIATIVELDKHINVRDIAYEVSASVSTVHTVLHEDLGLSKKATRWVPHLLTEELKKKRVDASNAFKILNEKKVAIVTMDETMVSFLTPLTKNQSKEWRPKGTPAPTKAKDLKTRKKQMVLTFFDVDGIVYTKYAPVGVKINTAYIVDVLGSFLKAMRNKRPNLMCSGDWMLHWDNAPVHTARLTTEFIEKKRHKNGATCSLLARSGTSGLLAVPED